MNRLFILTITILLALVPVYFLAGASDGDAADSADALYDQALELYRQGPSQASKIIERLQSALLADPNHDKAVRLLGITYFGTEQFENALIQFDRALALAEERDVILPRMLFYKARVLAELERDAEARKILEVYWAFFQEPDDLKRSYDLLYKSLDEPEE